MKDPLPRTNSKSTKIKTQGLSSISAEQRPAKTTQKSSAKFSGKAHGKSKSEESADLGFLESLKTEWNLFWENIVGDEDPASIATKGSSDKDPFASGKLEMLSLEQIKAITKVLSQDRAQLNQKLEQINRELEETMAKAQSLSLVGGDFEMAQLKTSQLNELGHQLAGDLMKLDEQLKLTRRHEDALKKKNSARK